MSSSSDIDSDNDTSEVGVKLKKGINASEMNVTDRAPVAQKVEVFPPSYIVLDVMQVSSMGHNVNVSIGHNCRMILLCCEL